MLFCDFWGPFVLIDFRKQTSTKACKGEDKVLIKFIPRKNIR